MDNVRQSSDYGEGGRKRERLKTKDSKSLHRFIMDISEMKCQVKDAMTALIYLFMNSFKQLL